MIALREAAIAGLLNRRHLARNLIAGVVVGVVALPLSLAFAIASGATPEAGLYTAIVAGFLAAMLGGSRVQVTGPTGAFIVILAAITAQHGFDGLQIATFMAGLILLGLGLAKLGGIIKFIPTPVIVGFTTGIAVIIFVGQWKDFFGLPAPPVGHFHEKFLHLLESLPNLHVATTLLGLFGLGLTLLTPKFLPRAIPGPLVAMLAVTLVQSVFQFDGVATIGSTFGGVPSSLPVFHWPEITLARIVELIGPAFTIAMLGAIESLLSAVVADGMTGTRHNSNQELVGQGVANIFSPMFGGFAATGAIARTATNVRNGANSPIAGMTHAAVLLLIILAAAPLAAHIPLAGLAAILFVVAYNMSEWRHFLNLVRTSPRNDKAVLLITFILTVFTDLVLAVNVGVILAALLFMKRMSETVKVEGMNAEEIELACPIGVPAGVQIYSIDGPFFFGAAETFENTLLGITSGVRLVVLRLGRVPLIDATGLAALERMSAQLTKRGICMILCEANERISAKLHNAGLAAGLDGRALQPDISAAILAAETCLQAQTSREGDNV